MSALRVLVVLAWIGFAAYWILSAFGAKRGSHRTREIPLRILIAAVVVVALRVLHLGAVDVHALALGVLGTIIVGCGLGFAVWARVHLGGNWGMPMTLKDQPELVTSGPYRFVRHPIYTGILTAVLGTALVINLIVLILAIILGAYFLYSASIEEKDLTAVFPETYPAYRAHTKMLLPFVL
jgi:protein-S-isoprenylcysteine O-methyltransferase Ste14